MSHKSEFRANVTNVAFTLPDAGIEPIEKFAEGPSAGAAELGAGRSSTNICPSEEGDDGAMTLDVGLFLSLLPFHFSKLAESGNGGFGIDEEDDIKKRTRMPYYESQLMLVIIAKSLPTKKANRT